LEKRKRRLEKSGMIDFMLANETGQTRRVSTDAFSRSLVSICVDSWQSRSLFDLSASRGFAEFLREHSSISTVTEEILRLTNITMFNATDGTGVFFKS
jgi:hypothetical protein